jgi:hypothetical protein
VPAYFEPRLGGRKEKNVSYSGACTQTGTVLLQSLNTSGPSTYGKLRGMLVMTLHPSSVIAPSSGACKNSFGTVLGSFSNHVECECAYDGGGFARNKCLAVEACVLVGIRFCLQINYPSTS